MDGGGFGVVNFGDAPKGSFGKPMNPIRIVDDEGADVPPGEPGELLFQVDDARRRRVEYYKNEKASDAKIRDGWLHTGDLVYADAEVISTSSTARPIRCGAAARTSPPGRWSGGSTVTRRCSNPPSSEFPRIWGRTR